MLIIISPAKKLNFEDSAPIDESHIPLFLDQSEELIRKLRGYTHNQVSKLMKLSDSLTTLNRNRYDDFERPFNLKNAKQAIFAFKGDTYVGLDIESFSNLEIKKADKQLRILSGLYGVIRPLDLIQPYRLEMGTKLTCNDSDNLYQYWSDTITTEINKDLKKEKILVNLASKEYFSVIDFKKIVGTVITPAFKEKSGNDYKVVGIHAKRARGMMSKFIIQNNVKTVEELQAFSDASYKYSKKLSTETEIVFTRNRK